MLELDEGKLSRPVLRRGGESNLASLSRPVCRSAKRAQWVRIFCPCRTISRSEEILIHARALVHPPPLRHRSVPSLHPHAALERSLPPMSPVPEPGRRSVGAVPLPPRMQTLLVQRLQAY